MVEGEIWEGVRKAVMKWGGGSDLRLVGFRMGLFVSEFQGIGEMAGKSRKVGV